MIISIAGTPGSGKTSVATILSQRLSMPFYSIGSLRGRMAKERGMTIDELNAHGENDGSTDRDVDAYQKQLGEEQDGFIIEGRLGWHFIPHSFKILLTCDLDEAAHRIFLARQLSKEERNDERTYASEEDAKEQIKQRMDSDTKRYQTYYGIDYQDPSHYDLILDTTHIVGAEAVTDLIERTLREKGLVP